ncbi:MAG: penicillin-binding protein 2 [Gammaproteobacteria bacterium]|nr:penicillin-binding protein 2 [Gammaproteobacteria bacterium]
MMIFEERQIEKNNFSSRAILLFGVVILSFLAILIKVFSLQVSGYSNYQLAALKNKNYVVPIQSLRGEIFDRKGRLLVRNEPTFDLITNPNLINDLDSFLEEIEPVIFLSDLEKTRYRKLYKNKAFINKELVLKKDLSQREIARFNVRSFNFKNVFIAKRYRRVSDYPDIFSHVLGYTSITENDFKNMPEIPKSHWKDVELNYAHGLISGQTGLEETYNDHLSGRHGKKVYEMNARGQFIKELEAYQPKQGSDLFTHLDIDAQKSAAEYIGNRRGAVVAIDLQSSGINVLYSSPSYSINKLSNGMSESEFKELKNNSEKPFFNRALQGRYPPASTIKPAIGMYGLSRGIIDWNFEIKDPGYFTLPETGRIYRGWLKGGHGKVNLRKAMLVSSNTFFFSLAYKSDIKELSDHLNGLGFGQKVCFDCFDEDQAFVPTPEWKYTKMNAGWVKGDTVNLGVGQGYLLATPMQLANYASILATKGKIEKASLVIVDKQKKSSILWEEKGFSSLDWNRMHDALLGVIESDYGTASSIRDLKDFQVAGKSGTAELVSLDSKEAYLEVRSAELLRDHSIIIAFGPMPNPKYAVSVVIENGESGGAVAGPVAIEVLKSLINE